jgi:peptidyl-prolyl cis-trans isomerase B (cyclophilin B)
MRNILIVAGVVAVAILVMAISCGKKEETAQPAQQAQQGQAVQAPAGEKIAVIETNKGVIKFRFFEADAPNTVANFIKLADKKFYDGLLWHRVEPGFVIQGGDPNGNGSGGPGYTIKAEFNKNPHLEGTVAMARAQDPDSAGSQFYICLAPAPFLNNNYTVFGQVTEGLDVVHKIQVGDKMLKVYITGK